LREKGGRESADRGTILAQTLIIRGEGPRRVLRIMNERIAAIPGDEEENIGE